MGRIFLTCCVFFGLAVDRADALPFLLDLNKGNGLYKKGDYPGAGQMYNKVLKKRPNEQRAKFNLGDALYKQGRYQESQRVFEGLTGKAVNKGLRQGSFYNLGNSLFKQEDYKGAVKSYEEALKLNPKDKDAQFNLKLAKKMLTMPKQKKKEEKPQKKDREQKKKNEQGQSQPKPGQMSREDAMRLLKALEDKTEHKAQRLKGGKANGKDW